MLSTKISGLGVNTEYSFFLVLKTSGGTYTSNTVTATTHEMTNLTGITITPGVMPGPLRESLEATAERIGAKIVDGVRIDTTHFVCTEPRGDSWQKAVDSNIPVVRPEWVQGCEREGKIVGVRGYYLDADPKLRQVGTNPVIQQQSRDSMADRIPVRTSSVAQTEEGEPGPTVGQTPEVQQGELNKKLPPAPESEESDVDEKSEDEQDEENQVQPEEATKKASVEDEKDEGMEDVAL